ncbi:hypothetical protein FHY55_02270 [Oceanicola sp. D3]|uniref:hypothetical protein n=1 Tax=Oceanicola sp. D3 TaxID=2587163 RepID=UPI00111CBEE7|nr:hypothetical protein [Oceanicola sp. D3]QDC08138.1 hypothetical protein FHY55_02270 [Oceanicola sp. D3]
MPISRYTPIIALAALSACLSLPTVPHTPGAVVQQALSGASIVGALSDGTSYCEFHDPGGLVVGRDTEVYAGNWRMNGDSICYTYTGEAPDCQFVQINGTRAVFVDMLGGTTLSQGNIVPGNVCS